MGRTVVVGYRSKPGKETVLKELIKHIYRVLAKEGLVRDKKSYLMEAADGTIVEVFEWLSGEAIEKAHTNPAVLEMWGNYAEICDYISAGNLAEIANLFSGFKPLN